MYPLIMHAPSVKLVSFYFIADSLLALDRMLDAGLLLANGPAAVGS